MSNKYRLSFMIVMVILLFLYLIGIVNISAETNFALTLAALILSISMSIDTFSKKNKFVEMMIFVLEVVALLVVVIFPNLKDQYIIKGIMGVLDTNVLLLLALFFTFASQWASEIKWKERENGRN